MAFHQHVAFILQAASGHPADEHGLVGFDGGPHQGLHVLAVDPQPPTGDEAGVAEEEPMRTGSVHVAVGGRQGERRSVQDGDRPRSRQLGANP